MARITEARLKHVRLVAGSEDVRLKSGRIRFE
jgi:hypothetical protein